MAESSFAIAGFEVGMKNALPPAIAFPTFGTIDFTFVVELGLLIELFAVAIVWWFLFVSMAAGLTIFITEPKKTVCTDIHFAVYFIKKFFLKMYQQTRALKT